MTQNLLTKHIKVFNALFKGRVHTTYHHARGVSHSAIGWLIDANHYSSDYIKYLNTELCIRSHTTRHIYVILLFVYVILILLVIFRYLN